MELRQQGVDVLAVGKRHKHDAHTALSAGGINAALGTMDAEDSREQRAADTIKEPYQLADPRIVEIMAKDAPEGIRELEAWGMPFAQENDGRISQGSSAPTGSTSLTARKWASTQTLSFWPPVATRRSGVRPRPAAMRTRRGSFRLAALAGARIRDAELVQFHPSGIMESADAAGLLISEPT